MHLRSTPTIVAIAAIAALVVVSCKPDDHLGAASDASTDAVSDACAILFGTPTDQTGLTLDRCRPRCACGGDVFSPPAYDDAFAQSLIDDWKLEAPYPELTSDPYAAPAPSGDPPETVCAMIPKGTAGTKPRPYALATFATADEATKAGGKVTHFGRCGVCSTLADLAVYMRNVDLTAPVRSCGLETGGDGGISADVACLQKLGFTLPCAQVWAYNTSNTRKQCLVVCLKNLDQPYNLDDGTLNPCLSCDEVQSGPVFKAIAGRTRRNTGLPNAICRPCSEVRAVVHAYE